MLDLSMLLGVLLVLLGKLNKVFPKPDFTWNVFIKTNLISTLMNLVAGIYLLINQAELIALFTKVSPGNPFLSGGLFAGIIGIAGLTIVQFLVDIANPKKKTVV